MIPVKREQSEITWPIRDLDLDGDRPDGPPLWLKIAGIVLALLVAAGVTRAFFPRTVERPVWVEKVLTPTPGPSPTPVVVERVATPTPGPSPTPVVIITERLVVATPSPGPSPTPVVIERVVEKVATPSPAPIPTARPGSGLLYQADWSQGLGGWPSRGGWKALNGMLLNDGTNDQDPIWAVAPYQPAVADYAVEAEIQIVRLASGWGNHFGIVVREKYRAGIYDGNSVKIFFYTPEKWDELRSVPFKRDNNWHTYRVEVQGNVIRVLIDGTIVAETIDNRYLSPGKVGLWSYQNQISVRSFRVIAL